MNVSSSYEENRSLKFEQKWSLHRVTKRALSSQRKSLHMYGLSFKSFIPINLIVSIFGLVTLVMFFPCVTPTLFCVCICLPQYPRCPCSAVFWSPLVVQVQTGLHVARSGLVRFGHQAPGQLHYTALHFDKAETCSLATNRTCQVSRHMR